MTGVVGVAGGVVGVTGAEALPGVPPTGWTMTRMVGALPFEGALQFGALGFWAQGAAGSVLAGLLLVTEVSPPQPIAASARTATDAPS